jgi:hypothetical protein
MAKKKTIISNMKKRGSKKSEFVVLSCRQQGDDLLLSYPESISSEFGKDDKTGEEYMRYLYEVEDGIIASHEDSPIQIPTTFIGDCEEMFSTSKNVMNDPDSFGVPTSLVKNIIKKKGFRWDWNKKKWKK